MALFAPTATAITNYASDFVNPDYVLAGNYPPGTLSAQQTIIQWADQRAKGGPWSEWIGKCVVWTGNAHRVNITDRRCR